MENEIKNKILSKIAYIVLMNKMKKIKNIDVSLKDEDFFYSSLDIENEYFYSFLMRDIGLKNYFGNKNEIIKKLADLNLIKVSSKLFIEDEDQENIEEIELYNENGKIIYILNGNEISPKEDEIFHKYKIHPEIFKEAEDVYEKLSTFIEKENNNFTFTENMTTYTVPLIYIDILIALDKIRDNHKDVITEMIEVSTIDLKYIKFIEKIDDVSYLTSLSIKQKVDENLSWKKTILLL